MKNLHCYSTLINLALLAAVWNIPNTIVVRQLAMLFLLITIATNALPSREILSKNWFLISFFCYLPLHLLMFSTDINREIKILIGPDFRMLVCAIIGFGLGGLLIKWSVKSVFLFLGISFSIPLYIHLFLFINKWIISEHFTFGYWGINLIHGDLGFAALVASLFLMMYLLKYAAKNY